jgi:peptidoglycan hydrolase-like protein with peptidoglycan-binding domain
MAVVLRPGDSNDLVRLLQARLNRDYPLYSNLVVDGIYGPRTTAVVREFQRRAGLTVDGIAGPQTLGRLGLNFDQPPPLPTDRPFFYCASGTWATPFQGHRSMSAGAWNRWALSAISLSDTRPPASSTRTRS